MKKLSLVLALVCFALGLSLAQRTVTGTVTDDKGEPLVGSSVVVKGTTNGTVSDVDGNFSLKVPNNASTLVISMVGYTTQEVTLGASNVVNVTLKESATGLQEVVVTAIGIQREKKALGYSVSDVSGDALAQRSEPDAIRSLSGKTPGVVIQGGGGSPGQSTKINIRGFSSLTGNTQPLFVVDGIPFDNSVNASTGASGGTQYSNRAYDIDPNNIESLTILKGAAAAALYGSRATNGVVVINTKAGKKNRKGLEVTYNSSVSWEKIAGLPDYQSKYGQGSNNVYNGGFIGNWGAPFGAYAEQINSQYGTDYPKIDSVAHPLVSLGYTKPRYSNVFPEFFQHDASGNFILDANGNRIPVKVPYRNHDFVNEFFETGLLTENSLTINAGGDNAGISATASRMDNKGIVPNAKSSRTALGIGGSGKLANGLVVSGNVNYVNTTQENPPSNGSIFESGWYGGAAEGSIFARLLYLPRNYDLTNYPFENPVDGSNVFYRALDNPRWLAKYNKYSSNVNRVFGNLALSYDVFDWLNLTARGGINTYSESRRNIQRPGGVASANGSVWTDDLTNTEIDFNYIATVKKNITDDIDFRLIAGLNLNQRSFSDRFIRGDNVISTGLYTLDGTSTQIAGADYSRKQRLYAIYADLQFGYKDYLYLGFVGRNDWSSTLPTKQNSYFYGGGNVAFVFSDAFHITNDIFSYGKVRAALTQVGNEAPPYYTATTYSLSSPFTTAGGTVYNRASYGDVLGNADLKNELTTEIELGTDLRFLRNRIGLDFTWYKRNSKEQITTTQLPASTGFNYARVNAGEIQNKGIEIGLDLTPIKTESGFNWNLYTTFTKNNSLIVDAGEGGDIFLGGPASSLGVIHRSGLPYGQLYGIRNARTPEGNLLIDPSTGTCIWEASSDIIGDPNPDFLMSFINTFTFKGLSLKGVFDWRQGGDMYSITTGALLARGQLKITEDREPLRIIPGVYGDASTQEPLLDENGKYIRNTTPITAFDYHFSNGFGPYGADETNVYDATVFRLREITLAYEFPKKVLKSTPFGSLRLSLSGRNLWYKAPYFAKGINIDPEVLAETADTNVQGLEYGSYPTTKRYGINLSVTF